MNDTKKSSPQSLGDIFAAKIPTKKPPAHQWQELALQIIKELNIPNFKKSSVFKVCKNYPKQYILNCFNDTKELCETGEKWKYFFKIVVNPNEKEEGVDSGK